MPHDLCLDTMVFIGVIDLSTFSSEMVQQNLNIGRKSGFWEDYHPHCQNRPGETSNPALDPITRREEGIMYMIMAGCFKICRTDGQQTFSTSTSVVAIGVIRRFSPSSGRIPTGMGFNHKITIKLWVEWIQGRQKPKKKKRGKDQNTFEA